MASTSHLGPKRNGRGRSRATAIIAVSSFFASDGDDGRRNTSYFGIIIVDLSPRCNDDLKSQAANHVAANTSIIFEQPPSRK